MGKAVSTAIRMLACVCLLTRPLLFCSTDVVLGYKDLEGKLHHKLIYYSCLPLCLLLTVYRTNEFYLGCSVGRVTNRTAGARFTLNGQTYNLTANAGNNHLHGGVVGFNKVKFDCSVQYTAYCMVL